MERASTQYDDVRGTAAADWHGAEVNLHALAAAAGIDTDRYFPVGLVLNGKELEGLALEVSRIYVVDTTDLPSKTFVAIRDHLRNNQGAVIAMDLETDIKLAPYMKRLQIVLGNRELDGLI